MTPKWRKRLLWLLLPFFGGPTIGSVVASELTGNFGKINFKHSLKKEVSKFIKSLGGGDQEQGDFTPVKLVSELVKDPNSIPLLMRGFATQVAKHIVDGSLFKDKKHTQQKQHFSSYLKGVKAQAEGFIKQKRKDTKRVKRDWVSDEEKYLSALENFVLGKIDTRSIESYYNSQDHLFAPLKGPVPSNSFSFIGFLMSQWLKGVKAGTFIHHIFPYAETFQEETSKNYKDKFNNITLPNKPNFWFPDFEQKKLEEWKKVANGNGEEGKGEQKITIKWVSSKNTPQTNLVLKYLSQGNEDNTSNTTCKDKKPEDGPLKLFCISNGESGPSNGTNSVEFVVCNGQGKQKKIFWRDANGFNFLLAHSNGSKKKKEGPKENFEKSKQQMVDEFKEYIKKNFSYLLLQYYLFINQGGFKNGEKETIPCFCKEVIESLVKLWKLNGELTELNDNLKIWDIRKVNNDVLKMVDYSGEGSNYLYKLGTVDANPPEFLKEVSKKTNLETISNSVSEHLKKLGDYFDKKSEGAQNQGKKIEHAELKGKENHGSGDHKDDKYWSFEDTKNSKDHKECMKRQIAEFLLEKISTMDLLKKTLLLPFSFEKISDLTQQISTKGEKESPNPLSELEKTLTKNYNGFFNFSGEGARRKRRSAPAPQTSQNKLIDMLHKAIKEELSVSQLSHVSDTLLYKLSSAGTEPAKNGSDKFGAIKNLLTINNLSKRPLQEANTLERSQTRLLVTSLYLLEDSLKEYRELLKNIIKEQLFGGYAFSLSWNKFCTQSDDKNPIDPSNGEANGGGSGGKKSFWTPIASSATASTPDPSSNGKEWDTKTLDPRRCIKTPDRYSVSTIKKPANGSGGNGSTNSEIQLMGYKGSLTRNSQLQLPGDLYEKIISFLLKEGHINWTDITKQIDLIKSNRQLYSVIQQLSKINSSLGEIFKLPDYKNLKEDVDESKKVEMLEWYGLTERKELLKKFIKEKITTGVNDIQLTLASSSTTDSSNGTHDKKAFSGLMWNSSGDKKAHVFSTKDSDEGSAVVYLIQYSADDVQSTEKFAKFLKEKLTPDAVIKDIVKKAQDPGLQAKAINHYLMRGNYAGGKVYNLVSDDYYLKDQFSSIIL
ncbi:hypothetical protein OVS_00205 [Mycoplasma ovis str. Michigan]|uniref:Uncharacterized protein n=1 Tax=Mycoplasma ovis str. Michigan TaxID=1415773 RepID=A0ABN4BM94_9MOLU|nr:DUF3713 domain-containing protein [Mycoplasma ovis]AHC40081.1 hypothetical protein OVS_00205 [Mycoplasma ovis str. Michigan]